MNRPVRKSWRTRWTYSGIYLVEHHRGNEHFYLAGKNRIKRVVCNPCRAAFIVNGKQSRMRESRGNGSRMHGYKIIRCWLAADSFLTFARFFSSFSRDRYRYFLTLYWTLIVTRLLLSAWINVVETERKNTNRSYSRCRCKHCLDFSMHASREIRPTLCEDLFSTYVNVFLRKLTEL